MNDNEPVPKIVKVFLVACAGTVIFGTWWDKKETNPHISDALKTLIASRKAFDHAQKDLTIPHLDGTGHSTIFVDDVVKDDDEICVKYTVFSKDRFRRGNPKRKLCMPVASQ